MAVLLLEPAFRAAGPARAHPCGAVVDATGRECGAKPALLFRKVCFHGHARDVRLCDAHEKGIGVCTCRECANLGARSHRCPVALVSMPEALDIIRAR